MFKKMILITLMAVSPAVWAQETIPQMTSPSSVSQPWQFGVGFGLGLGSRLVFSDVKFSNSSSEIKADLDFKNSANFIFEARNLQSSSWGFIGTLTYETKRELDSYDYSSNGVTLSFNASDDAPKVQVTLLSLNAAYRWNEFYMPFGFNFSRINWTESNSSSVTSIDAQGGVGFEFGGGYYIQKEIVIEGLIRATAVKLKLSNSTDSINFGKGYLSSLAISGKYLF